MNLVKRVISALLAATSIIACYIFFGPTGLSIFVLIAALFGLSEYTSISLTRLSPPRPFIVLFLAICSFLLINTTFLKVFFFELTGVTYVFFISVGLWTLRDKVENQKIYNLMTVSSLGFIYCTALPAFIIRTLFLEDGAIWFLTLLLVVSSGDTFAYFGGKWLGNRKLMPSLSPKKTIAGSVAGVLGSILAGVALHFTLFSQYPLFFLIPVCICSAFMAQSGDLFVSLIKRIADVKDSGKIMPGHGGILDRADGVYFAAPVIYFAARLAGSWF